MISYANQYSIQAAGKDDQVNASQLNDMVGENSEQLIRVQLFNIINSRWKMKTAHSGSLEDW